MEGFKTTKMIVGLFVLAIIGSAISHTIHDEMTSDEFAKLFPMIGTKEVEYDIIPIETSKIQKRDINGGTHISMKAFGKDIKLWLNPIDGTLATAETPVYSMKKGYNIVKYENLMKKVIDNLYHDENQTATVVMNEQPNGNIQLNGMIGSHNIYLQPVPESNIRKLLTYLRRFGFSVENIPEFGNHEYHIAFKLPETPEHLKILETPSITSLRSKRSASAPDTIYPEIMVIMDYPLFKLLRKNPYYAVGYILSFWNGVDLKYRTLQNPNYRLNIAGIVLATEPNSLEYMQYHSNYPRDFMVENALDASTYWLVELENLIEGNNFDVAITMTSEIFCAQKANGCKRGTLGLAFVGGACSPAFSDWKYGRIVSQTIKSAIVHDKSSFEGIMTAAHELGHLLGVKHDGDDNRGCDAEVGNLMAPTVSFTTNSSDWSYCSVQDFDQFVRNQQSECLFNKPKPGNALPRFLPGKLMSADEQCIRREGGKAAKSGEEICTVLHCLTPKNPSIMIGGPAAVDGTACGRGKMCLHGQCLDESQITN